MYTFEDVQQLLGGQFAVQYFTENRIKYVMHYLNNDIEQAQLFKIKIETEEQNLRDNFKNDTTS